MIRKALNLIHSHWIYLPVQMLVILVVAAAAGRPAAIHANSHELQIEIGIAAAISWSISAALAAFMESSRNSSGALTLDTFSRKPQWVIVSGRIWKQSLANFLGVLVASAICGVWYLTSAEIDAAYWLAMTTMAAKVATAPCAGVLSANLFGRYAGPLVASLVPLFAGVFLSAAYPRLGAVAGHLNVLTPDASRQLTMQQLVCLIPIWGTIAFGLVLVAASVIAKTNTAEALSGIKGLAIGAAAIVCAFGASLLVPASSHISEQDQVCHDVSGPENLTVCTWPGHDGVGKQLSHGMAALNSALPQELRVTGQLREGLGTNFSQRVPEQRGTWIDTPNLKRYFWLNGVSPNPSTVANAVVRALDVTAREKCGTLTDPGQPGIPPQAEFEIQAREIMLDGMIAQQEGRPLDRQPQNHATTSASQKWFHEAALALSRCQPLPASDATR